MQINDDFELKISLPFSSITVRESDKAANEADNKTPINTELEDFVKWKGGGWFSIVGGHLDNPNQAISYNQVS